VLKARESWERRACQKKSPIAGLNKPRTTGEEKKRKAEEGEDWEVGGTKM